MKTFILSLWLGLAGVAYAATDAENRENFLTAVTLAKKTNLAVAAFGKREREPPRGKDWIAFCEEMQKVSTRGKMVDTTFLDQIHPGLGEAFGKLKTGYFLWGAGLKNNDVLEQRKGSGMAVEWINFWTANRMDIITALESNEANDKAFQWDKKMTQAAVDRMLWDIQISQLVALAVKVGGIVLAATICLWLFRLARTRQTKGFMTALYHVSFVLGVVALFGLGFGRPPEQTALWWLSAFGMLSAGVLVAKGNKKPEL